MPTDEPNVIKHSLNEAAWLISRGVRPLAIPVAGLLSELPEGGLAWLRGVVESESYSGVYKKIRVTEETYEVFYASEEWALHLYSWACTKEVPPNHTEAIIGLLLGYSPQAISTYLRETTRKSSDPHCPR